MKSKRSSILIIFIVLAACATVPYTGRKQFNLLTPAQEIQLGEDAYKEVMKENKLTANEEWQAMIQRVGNRIKTVAERPDFTWEFNCLRGDAINAFALPGGKVAFWEGIIPVCRNETGIAVVMGHEIAHALASHGAERMSQGMGANIIAEIISVGLGNKDPQTRQSVLQYFGLGAQLGVMLPFSRKHESEADHIGLVLMARAGYDPHEAVDFWRRMSELGGGKPPEFLSTHPSDERRIRQIQEWMPEALQHYRPR